MDGKMKDEESSPDSSSIEKPDNGGINRRKFLTIAGAAGITVLGAKQILAGNGGGGGKENNCLMCHSQAPSSFVVDPATQQLIDRAHNLNIDLVWDRGPLCEFSHKGQGGAAGLCCFRCQMGPCTLGGATGKNRGACGATADVIAARDLVRRIAGGAASHIEHARAAAKTLKGVANGTIADYDIKDPAKLHALYAGLGCTGLNEALAVAETTLNDLGSGRGYACMAQLQG